MELNSNSPQLIEIISNLRQRFTLDLIGFSNNLFKDHTSIKTPQFHKEIMKDFSNLIYQYQVNGGGTPPGDKQSLIPPTILDKNKNTNSNNLQSSVYHENYKDFQILRNRALVMPREFAKSTMLWRLALWSSLNGYKKYIVYISDSEDKAVELMQPIKYELENNRMIKLIYGEQVTKDWSQGKFVLKNGCKFLARGKGQSVRGLRNLSYRPDLVILDDVENDKNVLNETLRKELQEWVDKQVLKGVDTAIGNVIIVGTILHFDSLLANIATKDQRPIKYLSFKPLVYAALDNGGKSIWEEKFSTQKLLDEKKADPYSFAQERMNEPIPVEAGMFKKEYFRYYKFQNNAVTKKNFLSDEEESFPLDSLNIYITVDLAVTDREYSDYTVIMATGVNHNSELFVLEYTRERYVDPDKIIEEIFRMYDKWSPKMVGIESVAFQRWLIVNIQKEMRKRGKFIPLQQLKADRDKTRRISQLQPRYSNHAVYTLPSMTELEEELLYFPKAPHDDVADTLSYVLQIMTAPEKKEIVIKKMGTFEWWKKLHKDSLNRNKRNKSRMRMSGLVPRT